MRNRCLTYTEEAALRRFFKTRGDTPAKRDWAWIRVLLTTGMRITEFSTLTVGEVKTAIRLKTLFIPKERRKKEACDLIVHVVGETAQALSDLLAINPKALDTAPLVPGRFDNPLTVRMYEMLTNKWGKAVGIDGLSPHWFRHTFAATLVADSSSENPSFVLARLSKMLGQVDPRSCMHYLTMSRDSSTGGQREMIERSFPAKNIRMTPARVRREFLGATA